MSLKQVVNKVIKDHVFTIIFFSISLLVTIAGTIFTPIELKHLIDIKTDVTFMNVLYLIFSTAFAILGVLGTKNAIFDFQYYLDREIKKVAYTAVLKSDYIDLEKLKIEETYSKIYRASNNLTEGYFTNGIMKATLLVIFSLCFICLFFYFNGLLGLASIILCVAYCAIKFKSLQSIKQKRSENEKAKENDNIYLNDVTNHLRQIKIDNAVEYEEEKYLNILNEDFNASRREAKAIDFEDRMLFIVFLIVTIILAVVFVFILDSRENTEQIVLSTGSIVGAFAILPLFYYNLSEITRCTPSKKTFREDILELNSILNVRDENRVVSINELEDINKVSFEEVTFVYPESSFFLKNLSFTIKKEESLGIVGTDRSGKSTLAYLLTKLLRPRQGRVTINDCDFKKIDTYYLRSLICVASVHSKLREDTIKNNIIGSEKLDLYRYNEAINKCHLRDFIDSLPKKDKTVLDSSIELHDSDKSKILLARAMYKDPKIMIFDSTFESLDQTTSLHIIDEFLKKKIIAVIVSSNPSILAKTTNLMLLDNGEAKEYGPSKSLLANPNTKTFRFIQKINRK